MSNITVKVGVMPGKMTALFLDEGRTIADAIRVANIDPSGFDLKHNGRSTSDFNEIVMDNDTVFLVKRIKGNYGDEKNYIAVGLKHDGCEDNYGVEEGTTVIEFLGTYTEISDADDYDLFVNGEPVDSYQRLHDGDIVGYAEKIAIVEPEDDDDCDNEPEKCCDCCGCGRPSFNEVAAAEVAAETGVKISVDGDRLNIRYSDIEISIKK